MKVLLLNGINCNSCIWDKFKTEMNKLSDNIEFFNISYPHHITLSSNRVIDISDWVDNYLDSKEFDVVIGHSIGGIIALELSSIFNRDFKKIILIESNLRPVSEDYQVFLTENHINKLGDIILKMIKSESRFYNLELKKTLYEDFDYSYLLHNKCLPTYAFYGDRGNKNIPDLITGLSLNDDIISKINLSFISNSAYYVMLENPRLLSKKIYKLISN